MQIISYVFTNLLVNTDYIMSLHNGWSMQIATYVIAKRHCIIYHCKAALHHMSSQRG